MDRLHRMEEAARLLGIHPQTLRARDSQGNTRVVRTPGGKRRTRESEVRRLQGEHAARADRPRTWVVQARVPSHAQKARGDLARQAAHVRDRSQGQEARTLEITDVASGLSDERPGLLPSRIGTG